MGLEIEFTEGMQFDKGYISAYFVTDQERMEAVLEDAYVLLHGGKISSMADFLPLLEKVAQAQEAAAGDRRGRRRRGAVDAGRQQDPRPAGRGRGQGARLRRPAEGDARGHGRADRRPGGQRGGRPQAGQRRPGRAGPRPPRRGDQGHHHDRRRRRRRRPRSRTGSASCAPRSRTPTPTGTARSCRSGWPSCPAASPCSGSGAATEVELKEKKHRLEDAISATRAAIEEGIIAGGGSALVQIAAGLGDLGKTGDEATGRARSCSRALEAPCRWIAETPAPRAAWWSRSRRPPAGPRLQRRDRRVRRPDGAGRHRPGQGDPLRGAERGVDRRDAADHRGPGHGQAGARGRRPTATVTATRTEPVTRGQSHGASRTGQSHGASRTGPGRRARHRSHRGGVPAGLLARPGPGTALVRARPVPMSLG